MDRRASSPSLRRQDNWVWVKDETRRCMNMRDVWERRWYEYDAKNRTISLFDEGGEGPGGGGERKLLKRYKANGVSEVPPRKGKRRWRFDVLADVINDIETGDAGEDTFNHDEIKNEWRAFAGENEAQMKKFVEEIQNANHDEALTTQQQIAKFKAERDRKREFGWRGILNTALIISLIGVMLGAACTWWANRFESNARMYLALSCLSTLGWLLVLLGLTLASTVSAAPDSTAIDFDKFAQVRPTRVQTAHSLVVC